MFKKIWLQSGFSLVQGMILASVIAGSALVASKMLSEQKLVQKTAESKDQIEELHKVIFATLQNRSNCEATVLTPNVQGSLLSGSNPVVPAIRNGGSTPAFVRFNDTDPTTHVTYMNGSVAITGMQFFYNPASPSGLGRFEITYSRFESGKAPLPAGAVIKRTKEGYGGKQIKKSMSLRIQRNPNLASRPFVSCYAVEGDGSNDISRQICQNLNREEVLFLWDEATSSCIPQTQCQDHLIYAGIDSMGRLICRTPAEWIKFQDMIEATDGSCATGQHVGFQIIGTNPIKVRIRCQ